MADFYESLAALYQRLAQEQAQQQRQPQGPATTTDRLAGQLGSPNAAGGGGFGLMDLIAGAGGGGGGGMPMPAMGGGIPMPSGGFPGFTAAGQPGSASDYGMSPFLTRQGISGVPAGVRGLIRGAHAENIPVGMLSEAIFGSGPRSYQEQANLYAQHLSGAHPGPVAPPGHSMHEVGRAWDISTTFLGQHPEYRNWLLGHGFEFPVANDAPHVEWQGPAGQLRPPHVPVSTPARPQRRPLQRRTSSLPSSSYSAAALARRT